MSTIKKIKVYNMESSNGNIIPNQFEIQTDEGEYFQSYNCTIVAVIKGKTFLDKTHWDYSKTTGKYRNIFLDENIKETREKIKSGEYTLIDLNN